MYERGGWTASLGGLAARPGGQHYLVVVLVLCTHFGVMVTRGILWLLMMAGHAVSAAFMREMEHDADRTESRVAGSAAFESAMNKLPVLNAVYGQLFRMVQEVWQRQHQLPDNLPGFVEYGMARVAPEDRAAIWNQASQRKAAWLDTHPSLAERVHRARQRADVGCEISDAPARELFEDFDGLCCQVTRAYYTDDLKLRARRDALLPRDQFLQTAANLPPAPPLPSVLPRSKPVRKPAGTSGTGYDPRRHLDPRPPVEPRSR